MNSEQLLLMLENDPEQVSFDDVISIIDNEYIFTPSQFTNGNLTNLAGENSGSCKIFAFAKSHALSMMQTLHCFGDYYRNDVLNKPEENNHQNIRNFMNTGWDGIEFSSRPLRAKQDG